MRLPRRSAVAVVLLAVGALLPGLARAAEEGIVLRGAISSWVDVTIHESVEIPRADIDVTSAGRFAGFYLLPHFSTHEPVGALWSPRLGAPTSASLLPLGDTWTVTAGAYRLYLLAEARTEVFIPLPGSALRAYQPRNRASVSLRLMDFVVPPDATGVERRVTVAASSRRSLVAAVSYATSTSVTGMDQSSACLASSAQACSAIPQTRLGTTSAQSYQVGLQGAGRYDGVFRLTRGVGLHGETTVRTGVLVLNS